ncbi:MAG: gluconokinase [Woeseia sp.]
MIIVIMGVSGSGKTTVGRALAKRLGLAFEDADDFHSRKNVKKMSKGTPLDDADRSEWLGELAAHLPTWNKKGGAVLACSALKESYRNRLQAQCSDVTWVYLQGTREQVKERLQARTGHYFDPKLLESQFRTLEEPASAVTISIDQPVTEIVEKLAAIFR